MKYAILEEIKKTLLLINTLVKKECLTVEEKEETNRVLEQQYKKLEELQSSLVSSITEKGKELNDLQM